MARDVGLTPKPVKGTGPAGQGITITGNVSVVGNSGFSIGRFLDGFMIVNGGFSGINRTLIGSIPLATYIVINQSVGVNNILHQGPDRGMIEATRSRRPAAEGRPSRSPCVPPMPASRNVRIGFQDRYISRPSAVGHQGFTGAVGGLRPVE